jgi:DNA-binding NarL/FixJ family response regulator
MRVFLVDDENEVRPRLARMLSEIPGLLVSAVASRAGDVLPQIIRFQTDAAIVDMRLQKGGALDLIRSIKALPLPPVVIALSTSHSIAYRSSCQKAGADFFFDKVHEQDRLIEVLTQLVEELRRKRQNSHITKK